MNMKDIFHDENIHADRSFVTVGFEILPYNLQNIHFPDIVIRNMKLIWTYFDTFICNYIRSAGYCTISLCVLIVKKYYP